ncbi:CRISPR-associated endonuclease Cas1 [Candidatus Nitrososphaera evergladensis SR1]|uniref:CRISPR-associated endonuclease Cas1 n=1 Tax=Candidatus Nitrososphaera evergladensis SR1 TaxID=1459636 RepID=A0A075MVU6_9ARCH|nr:CRISPR-associated endonuclease Cas1 [Candidatus Nitrososphaera evergladensis]AIF83429.1 CRISPR-associated endonuclease Cas1 [Candidatus Nitrososphaera evergladensis SR1]
MTLKGRKNHYNIKMLKGYGASISLKDKKVCLKGGRDAFTGKQDIEEWFVSQIPYEKIVLAGRGYVSTDAIQLLTQHNVNVILLDSYGNLITNMTRVMVSETATRYRMGQYDTFRSPGKVLYLQKKNLTAKLQSQIDFLQSLQKSELTDCINGLKKYKSRIEKQRDKRDLLRIEAGAGQLYFRYYTGLFDSKFGFDSRNGGGIKTGNRYASDVINALLNYGYSVLAAEIAKFVHGCGLDPYYGFFHKADTSFQALIYDLIEPFRWLVEYAVYKLAVEAPQHGRAIRKDEYAWTRESRIILDDALIRRFLELLERKLQSERPYRFRHGLKRRDGLSLCQEITITKINVQQLADYCVAN